MLCSGKTKPRKDKGLLECSLVEHGLHYLRELVSKQFGVRESPGCTPLYKQGFGAVLV